jgi:acyl-CoA dehydrogenase
VTDNVREVAEATESILDGWLERDKGELWDAGTWSQLAAAGLTQIAVSESAGGGGGSLREAAEVVRVAGGRCLRAPVAETSLVASWLLETAGMSIPAGVLSVSTSTDGVLAETDDPDGWVLRGVLRKIPYGRVADALVLVAKTERGPLAVVVDPAGLKLVEGEDLAGEPLDDLAVEGLRVAGTRAAPITFDTARQLSMRLALSRLMLCSGAASQVLQMTLRYAGEREQFGRAIGRFQAVQQLVAELAGEVAAMEIGADAALLALESGASNAWLAIASAKTDAERSISRLTAIAHQVHGAIGATQEHQLHRFSRRLWSWREEGGAASFWAVVIADRLLADGSPSLWEQVVG